MRAALAFTLVAMLTACGSEEDAPSLRLRVEAAPAVTRPVETVEVAVTPLSEAAQAKIDAIDVILKRNSLARFARLADGEPSFVSNFAGESNRVHWDLLRRTGFDPLSQLETLFAGPYGTRTVGDETWYIWPDLAAKSPSELVPERLSFSDRARLLELIGERGIQRIRDGQGYPGVRTAIAEDGRWLYFVHESEGEAVGDE
jgi:hypothetical protein